MLYLNGFELGPGFNWDTVCIAYGPCTQYGASSKWKSHITNVDENK